MPPQTRYKLPRPKLNILDYAHRAAVWSLFGLSIWGGWMMLATAQSRRGEQGIMLPPDVLRTPSEREEDKKVFLEIQQQVAANKAKEMQQPT